MWGFTCTEWEQNQISHDITSRMHINNRTNHRRYVFTLSPHWISCLYTLWSHMFSRWGHSHILFFPLCQQGSFYTPATDTASWSSALRALASSFFFSLTFKASTTSPKCLSTHSNSHATVTSRGASVFSVDWVVQAIKLHTIFCEAFVNYHTRGYTHALCTTQQPPA